MVLEIFPSTDLPPDVHRQGNAPSLEEAKRQFSASWEAWKTWAKLVEEEMTDQRRRYEPRVFEGRVLTPEEQEQMHQELLEFERIEAVSDSMRELIEAVWPELVHKLPPREP